MKKWIIIALVVVAIVVIIVVCKKQMKKKKDAAKGDGSTANDDGTSTLTNEDGSTNQGALTNMIQNLDGHNLTSVEQQQLIQALTSNVPELETELPNAADTSMVGDN